MIPILGHHAAPQVNNTAKVKLFWLQESHITCERGRLGVNGTFIEHSHDLANKVFGNEIGKW